MRCVAFMRNVNQSQRGHPATADILGGFADAGCPDVETFQSNGTIVFDAADPADVVARAEEAIEARSGYDREILWIPWSDIVTVVDEHGAAASEWRRYEFTLHHGGTIDVRDPDLQAVAAANRCEVVDAGPGWAVVHNKIDREGHATPVLERLTGARATSRGLPTLVRLVSRFGT